MSYPATTTFADSDDELSECESHLSLMSDSAGNNYPSPIAQRAYPTRDLGQLQPETPPLARRLDETSPTFQVLEKERARLEVIDSATERELAAFLRSGVTGTDALMEKSRLTKARLNVCLQNCARLELEMTRAHRLNPGAPFSDQLERQRSATFSALRDVSLAVIKILTDMEALAVSRLHEYDALSGDASQARSDHVQVLQQLHSEVSRLQGVLKEQHAGGVHLESVVGSQRQAGSKLHLRLKYTETELATLKTYSDLANNEGRNLQKGLLSAHQVIQSLQDEIKTLGDLKGKSSDDARITSQQLLLATAALEAEARSKLIVENNLKDMQDSYVQLQGVLINCEGQVKDATVEIQTLRRERDRHAQSNSEHTSSQGQELAQCHEERTSLGSQLASLQSTLRNEQIGNQSLRNCVHRLQEEKSNYTPPSCPICPTLRAQLDAGCQECPPLRSKIQLMSQAHDFTVQGLQHKISCTENQVQAIQAQMHDQNRTLSAARDEALRKLREAEALLRHAAPQSHQPYPPPCPQCPVHLAKISQLEGIVSALREELRRGQAPDGGDLNESEVHADFCCAHELFVEPPPPPSTTRHRQAPLPHLRFALRTLLDQVPEGDALVPPRLGT